MIGRETKQPPKCKEIQSAQTYAEIKKILPMILKTFKKFFYQTSIKL
jgi:hypothetical protein